MVIRDYCRKIVHLTLPIPYHTHISIPLRTFVHLRQTHITNNWNLSLEIPLYPSASCEACYPSPKKVLLRCSSMITLPLFSRRNAPCRKQFFLRSLTISMISTFHFPLGLLGLLSSSCLLSFDYICSRPSSPWCYYRCYYPTDPHPK